MHKGHSTSDVVHVHEWNTTKVPYIIVITTDKQLLNVAIR